MWQRWNGTTHVYEKSDDSGATWALLPLNASIISEGSIADGRLSANVALLNVPDTFASWISATTVRGTSAAVTPLSGVGVEVAYNTAIDIGSITSYDRTNSVYKPIAIIGSTIDFRPSGTVVLAVTAGAAAVTGTLAVSNWVSAGFVRATGLTPPSTGAGMELMYSGGAGYLLSYDRSAGLMSPMQVQGSTINFTDGTGQKILFLDGAGHMNVGAPTMNTGAPKLTVQGAILISTSADAPPYTQQRIALYNDNGNWGYLAYGTDANMRIVYSNISGNHLLLFGQSSGYANTGTFNEDLRIGAGAVSVTGTLNVSGTLTGAGQVRANADWFYNGTGGQGLYNAALAMHFAADGTYWSMAFNGAAAGGLRFFQNWGGTIKGYIHWDGAGFGLLNSAGNWALRVDTSNNVNFSLPLTQDYGKYIYPGSMTNGGVQTSFFMSSHSSFGLYINTGLYLEGPVYPSAVSSRGVLSAPTAQLSQYLQFTTAFGYGSSPQGSMFIDPQFGTTIRACTGSQIDFSVINVPNNAHIMYCPTGTNNITFPGAVHGLATFVTDGTGDIAGGIISRAGAGGTAGLQWTMYWTGGAFNTYVGSVYTGTIQMQSDARLKTNIQTIPSALAALKQLRPVTFEWAPTLSHAEPGIHHGLIGQEVETVLPDVVRRLNGPIAGMPADARRVDYIGLIPLLIRAVQELSAEMDELRGH